MNISSDEDGTRSSRRVDRAPIADKLKNEPASQCSSNMLSVAPKEPAILSIKYQYFLTLPGLAIAFSLLLTLCCKLLLGNGLMSLKKSSKAKTCTRPVLTQVTKQEVRQALHLTRPR